MKSFLVLCICTYVPCFTRMPGHTHRHRHMGCCKSFSLSLLSPVVATALSCQVETEETFSPSLPPTFGREREREREMIGKKEREKTYPLSRD